MNEREVKKGLSNAICSRTGRPCRCEVGAGCSRTPSSKALDADSSAALRWARVSLLRLEDAAEALERALFLLPFERVHPAPEWGDKLRRINALIAELDEEMKA